MISFLLINFIPLIKIIFIVIIRIFLLTNNLGKCLLIGIIFSALYFILIYSRKKLLRLSNLRKFRLNQLYKYKFNNKRERYINMIILITYFVIFFILILSLRIFNRNKSLDLIEYYFTMTDLLQKTNWLEIILNICLFVSALVLYILLMIKLLRYFKLHVLKRHIFNMNPKTNLWYLTVFFHKLGKINVFGLQDTLGRFIEVIYDKCYFRYRHKDYGTNFETLSFSEQTEIQMKAPVEPSCLLIKYKAIWPIIKHILLKGHYVILSTLLLYDIIYNDYIITKIYYILPFSFFYEIYLRISIFTDNLHTSYDEKIHRLIYAETLEIYDKDLLLINEELYDYNLMKKIYKTYIARDFIKDKDNLDY